MTKNKITLKEVWLKADDTDKIAFFDWLRLHGCERDRENSNEVMYAMAKFGYEW